MGDLTVRQYGKKLSDIREDHVNRYKFAIEKLYLEEKILDAACGCGYGSWMLHEDGKDVTGLDISEHALNFAKSFWSGPKYIKADVQAQTLDCYDAIISFETLEHLPHPDLALRKFRNSTSGLLLASVPNQDIYPFDSEKFKNDPYPHLRHYTPREFEDLLESADFEVLDKFCQKNKSGKVVPGTDGMFLVYVCR